MALEKQIWIEDIAENLFRDNPHVPFSIDESQFVDNKTVHRPNESGNPNIKVNRDVVPAAISELSDTEKTYNLDEFTTDPILVRNIDELQLSYDKRQSVIGRHRRVLSQRLGDVTAENWATTTSGRIVETSGGDSDFALAPSATGTRKAVVLKDLLKLAKEMDAENIPREGRVLLMPSDMYWQLLQDSDIKNTEVMGNTSIPSGVVTQIAGFNIMIRSRALVYKDGGSSLVTVGASTSGSDELGCLAWQRDFVAQATGDIDVFENEQDATMYGSVMSALVMHGAAKAYKDETGIFALIQK